MAEVLVYTEEYRLEYHKEGFMLEREEHKSRSDAAMASRSKSKIPVLLYRYTGPPRNIGFTFSRYDLNMDAGGIAPGEMLFIYEGDFEYLKPAVSRVFPLSDPFTGEEMTSLDPCWENPIPKSQWESILSELEQQPVTDSELQDFQNQFISWARNHLKTADGIEITGNL
ncbi:hypothetical protein NSS64_17290 [Paenibacillus sp. FSL H8-0122]|uniref:hypothetical protein n=1 Tax=Paenibacillus sp. FSL H8-0122 TaxID=2954510 RepID=UPI0030F70BE1